MTGRRHVGAESTLDIPGLDTFSTDRSRPSKTNCTSAESEFETDESASEDLTPDDWWRRKNEIVEDRIEVDGEEYRVLDGGVG